MDKQAAALCLDLGAFHGKLTRGYPAKVGSWQCCFGIYRFFREMISQVLYVGAQ